MQLFVDADKLIYIKRPWDSAILCIFGRIAINIQKSSSRIFIATVIIFNLNSIASVVDSQLQLLPSVRLNFSIATV